VQLLATLRALPSHPIIQINHPRFRYQSLFDVAHWDGVAWPPPFPPDFDAMEVVAGYSASNNPGDRRLDDSLRDFYTLYDHGHPVAAIGGSDTHDFNWVLDGSARTYAFADSAHGFDQPAFIAAIRARRTIATSGPSVEGGGTVGPGQSLVADHGGVWVSVTVAQTKWMHVDRILITSGTKVAQTIPVPAGARTHHWAGRIDVGTDDTFIGISADGDTALPLELTGTYQKDKWKHAGVTPFAVASPILIDANADGHWKRGDADLTLH